MKDEVLERKNEKKAKGVCMDASGRRGGGRRVRGAGRNDTCEG
jgi:hypothetical protein